MASNSARETGAGGVSVRVIVRSSDRTARPGATWLQAGSADGAEPASTSSAAVAARMVSTLSVVTKIRPGVADRRQRILQPVIHAEVADDVVVEGVEVEDREEVHRLVLLHVDHLHRAVLDRVQEVAAGLVRGDDDLAGLAGLGDGAHDAGAGLGIEADHAGQVRDGPG